MQNEIYEIDAQIQEKHWWFVVRRNLFSKFIKSFKLAKDAKILDIGSSSGTNLKMLKELGFVNYHGFDNNILSQKFCAQKQFGDVIIGDFNEANLEKNSYDLILATDVLEHIEDDEKAISQIKNFLKEGGFAIITVPCFMSLWSRHDEILMHKRRYLIAEILEKLRVQKLIILEKFYFNFLLFLPIFFFRKITKFLGINGGCENQINLSFLNKILLKIFTFDVFLARKIKPPFGVSAFILVKKN
jgi:SAM-dependent methyltransferase